MRHTKYILLALFCFVFASMTAQVPLKKQWGELYVSFSNGLIFNSRNDYLQERVQYVPKFSVGVELRVYKDFIAFGELQVRVKQAYAPKKDLALFGELSPYSNTGFLSNYQHINNTNDAALNIGLGYRFHAEKWKITPFIGWGGYSLDGYDYMQKIILKEFNTTNIFRSEYYQENQLGTRNNLQLGVRTTYKLKNRKSILIGLKYEMYLEPLKFGSTYSDYYTKEILRKISQDIHSHYLEFSVGIAFH